MVTGEVSLEKHVTGSDVSFVQLPLPIYERELTPEERNMHGAYWSKLARLVPNSYFSPERPILNFMEIGLGLPTLTAEVKSMGFQMGLIDLFGFSGPSPDLDRIRTILAAAGPSHIYLMSPMTCGYSIFQSVGEIIRELYPDAAIVAGGAHVAKLPERTLSESPFLDIAATDSKFTIGDLLDAILLRRNISQAKGIAYRQEGNIVRSDDGLQGLGRRKRNTSSGALDLDILPSRYKESSWARIYTSLGCAYTCSYCADVMHIGRKPVTFSLDTVMNTVDQLRERFGVKLFYVGDETFTYEPEHATRFAREIGKRDVYWIAQTRVDCVDERTLGELASNRCILLKFGAENASTSILRTMNKNTTACQIKDATSLAKRVGLNVFTYWMTGLPGETEATVRESMDLQRELFESGSCDLAEDVIFVPYPGTDIYNNPAKYGISIEQKPWAQWREDMPSVTSTCKLSSTRIYELWLKKIDALGNLIRGK